MYFPYDTNGTPLGFIYNGTQYFYMTNQMGDVVGITESDGSLIAAYVYDEWGSLGTFAGDLKDNVLYSGLLNRYRILNRISLVVSMFSSVGGFIATIIDVMDGNWDGYLIFKLSKRKVILL